MVKKKSTNGKGDATLGPGIAGKKKKWGAKNVLHSPFSTAPPPALAGSAECVCDALKAAFPVPPLRRVQALREIPDNVSDASASCTSSEGGDETGVREMSRSSKLGHAGMRLDTSALPFAEDDTRALASDQAKQDLGVSSTSPPKLQRAAKASSSSTGRPAGMFFGMNEVTKGLEKDKVSLVVFARDVSPPILFAHLPVLCYMRDAALVVCSGSGKDFAKLLGVKRMLAFAIARPSSIPEGPSRDLIEKLYADLLPHVATMDFPWLATARGKSVPPHFPEPIVAPANKLL